MDLSWLYRKAWAVADPEYFPLGGDSIKKKCRVFMATRLCLGPPLGLSVSDHLSFEPTILMAVFGWKMSFVWPCVASKEPCHWWFCWISLRDGSAENFINPICFVGIVCEVSISKFFNFFLASWCYVVTVVMVVSLTFHCFCTTRQAKDVVKSLKRRIRNKNPKIQLLALTVSTSSSHVAMYSLKKQPIIIISLLAFLASTILTIS